MDQATACGTYEKPEILERGTLAGLTASSTLYAGAQVLKLSAGFAASVVGPPTPSPGPGDIPLPGPDGGPGIPDIPDTPGEPDGAPGSLTAVGGDGGGSPGGGGAGEPRGGGSSGGELPFTGYAAMMVAGVGALLAATGGRLRRALRRDDPTD
jgi:hypothetical protein